MKAGKIIGFLAALTLIAAAVFFWNALSSSSAADSPAAARALSEETKRRVQLLDKYSAAQDSLGETTRLLKEATDNDLRLQQEIKSFEIALATPGELTSDQASGVREQITILRTQFVANQRKINDLNQQLAAKQTASDEIEKELNDQEAAAAQAAQPMDALTRLRRFLHFSS